MWSTHVVNTLLNNVQTTRHYLMVGIHSLVHEQVVCSTTWYAVKVPCYNHWDVGTGCNFFQPLWWGLCGGVSDVVVCMM